MSTYKSPNEIHLNFETGGREAIERLVEAYGFTTRQALADHLKVSKSTLANRYLRDTFPSDWIIQCSLDTGASLIWLTTGNGPQFDNKKSDIVTIQSRKLLDGKLYDSGFVMFDKVLISDKIDSPEIITFNNKAYLSDSSFSDIVDGMWVVEVEGKVSLRTLTRIPVGKLRVANFDGAAFECGISDINPIAKCHSIVLMPV